MEENESVQIRIFWSLRPNVALTASLMVKISIEEIEQTGGRLYRISSLFRAMLQPMQSRNILNIF